MIKSFKNRRVNQRQEVEVYRNLNRGGYSIRQGGLVVGHAEALMLRDADFVVNPAGHARYLREGVRNVHAWVQGRLINSGMGTTPEDADRMPGVHYDLKHGRFISDLTRPPTRVNGAMVVALNSRGAFAAYFTERP